MCGRGRNQSRIVVGGDAGDAAGGGGGGSGRCSCGYSTFALALTSARVSQTSSALHCATRSLIASLMECLRPYPSCRCCRRDRSRNTHRANIMR